MYLEENMIPVVWKSTLVMLLYILGVFINIRSTNAVVLLIHSSVQTILTLLFKFDFWFYKVLFLYASMFKEWTLPSSLQYKTHLSRLYNCRSLRCSWSIAYWRCFNYIFILDLTPGFIGLGKDNCKTRRETIKFGDSDAPYIRDFMILIMSSEILKGIDHYSCVIMNPPITKKSMGCQPPDHYNDITWVSWYVKSLAYQLFVQQFVKADLKEKINALHYWSFVRGIHWWPVDSPHKGPVIQKASPYHDIITSPEDCKMSVTPGKDVCGVWYMIYCKILALLNKLSH